LQLAARAIFQACGSFKLDKLDEGEAAGWWDGLSDARFIPVPCSWNDLFDDA
jgi:beta-glucuronidase